MKLQFIEQKYQIECIENIVSAVKGIHFGDISVDTLKSNVNLLDIYKQKQKDKKQLDVLMETGTGKTFTYIETMFKLHEVYGQKKFIIFVPSLAIKAGTLKNLEITEKYFNDKYRKRLAYYSYNGAESLSQIKRFITSDELAVLILTPQSINKKDNILQKKQENMPLASGISSYAQAMAKKNPVIIIDEPHKFEGDKFNQAFSIFENSLSIRFGATYPLEGNYTLSNIVYRLDSIKAFRQNLVKKIQIYTEITYTDNITLKKIEKNKVVLSYLKDSIPHEVQLKEKEDIGDKTNIGKYKGISIKNIVPNKDKIILSDDSEMTKNNDNYYLDDEQLKSLISQSIRLHFEKEERLFTLGIKSLCLFFIPSIDDYRGASPRVRKIFEAEYSTQREKKLEENISVKYREYLKQDLKEEQLHVHEGYFSGDKGTKEEQTKMGVDLILRDKEKLLSFETPLRFIFSVWALQEGWDNPNILTLCKLSSRGSEISKLQQIGRGLRLCVNQEGKRQLREHFDGESDFHGVNSLDVVVSEQELGFASEIQNEISKNLIVNGKFHRSVFDGILNDSQSNRLIILLEDEKAVQLVTDDEYQVIATDMVKVLSGEPFMALYKKQEISTQQQAEILKVFTENIDDYVQDKNRDKRQPIRIHADRLKTFKELWEEIKRKTKYEFQNIDDPSNIILQIVDAIKKININAIFVEERHDEVIVDDSIYVKTTQNRTKKREYHIPKTEFTKEIAQSTKMPLLFVAKILNTANMWEVFNKNPHEAKQEITSIVNHHLFNQLQSIVEYQLENTIHIANSLQDEKGNYLKQLEAGTLGKRQELLDDISDMGFKEKWLYENVIEYDSHIEKDLIIHKSNVEGVEVFAKLPAIAIPTPIGKYNPDFAYLVHYSSGKKLYLVVESKGYGTTQDIPADEQQKMGYARKFFEALQNNNKNENLTIAYRPYINTSDLGNIIAELRENSPNRK